MHSVPGAIVQETGSKCLIEQGASSKIIELNPIMYSIPPGVETGHGFFGWFMRAYVNTFIARAATTDAKFVQDGPLWLAFAADEYAGVPALKGAMHQARALKQAASLSKTHPTISKEVLDQMEFTDDAIPPSSAVGCSSTLVFKGIVYLLNRIRTFFANSDYVYVYCSCPSPKHPALVQPQVYIYIIFFFKKKQVFVYWQDVPKK